MRAFCDFAHEKTGEKRWRESGGHESGYDLRTIQKLLGHRDVRTTMIYTHVLNRGPLGVCSPLDRL